MRIHTDITQHVDTSSQLHYITRTHSLTDCESHYCPGSTLRAELWEPTEMVVHDLHNLQQQLVYGRHCYLTHTYWRSNSVLWSLVYSVTMAAISLTWRQRHPKPTLGNCITYLAVPSHYKPWSCVVTAHSGNNLFTSQRTWIESISTIAASHRTLTSVNWLNCP